MDKKNLISQSAQSANNLAIQDLPSELAELSEEILSEVRGGWENPDILGQIKVFSPIKLCCFCWTDPDISM